MSQNTIDFPCQKCGGETQWDPDQDALACPYCGHTQAVERASGEIIERALKDAPDAEQGLGQEVSVNACQNCSARITFDGPATTQRCLYCGSASVLPQSANRKLIRPESLVPLEVGADAVRERFVSWVQKLWFRPNALKNTRQFDAQGIYVPYWTFDCDVASQWTADAGYYYHVNETVPIKVDGKTQMQTRKVRKTKWRPARGQRQDHHDDHPIPASSSINERLAARLGSFELKGLVRYQPEFLAGWHAEEYQLELGDAWDKAKAAVVQIQKRRCGQDVPGDTQRRLAVNNRFSDVRWKHVLFPLWSLQYQFGGKTYTVLIHGQTGKIVGEAPKSWWKIIGFIGAIVGAIALAATLLGR